MEQEKEAVRGSGGQRTTLKPKLKHTLKIIKWDGEEPEGVEDAKSHPRCLEILEWEVGQKPKVTFRR